MRNTDPNAKHYSKRCGGREIDVVIVWRLDHWGRSLADLVTTLQELTQLGIGFICQHWPRPRWNAWALKSRLPSWKETTTQAEQRKFLQVV